MPDFIDPHDRMSYFGPRRAFDYSRYHWTGEKHPAPREIEAFFALSPNARIIIDPEHGPKPVCFLTGTHNFGHPGREHLVIAREWGDLTWPVWLERQRQTAPIEHARWLAEQFQGLRDAIRASARRIAEANRLPLDRYERYNHA